MTVDRVPTGVASHSTEANPPEAERFGVHSLPQSVGPERLLRSPLEFGVVASYERPDRGFALVAVGEAGVADLAVGESPTALRRAVRRLLPAGRWRGERWLRPRLLGGFRFAPAGPAGPEWDAFGAGRLVLPRMLFVQSGSRSGVVLAPGVESRELESFLDQLDAEGETRDSARGSKRPFIEPVDGAGWCRSVRSIAGEIAEGRFEKAVLATSREMVSDTDLAVGEALADLRARYPRCHLFSFTAGDSTFLGASPELLVRRRAGRVETLSLAGSRPRGKNGAEDRALGLELLGDTKSREEHDVVVRSIAECLDEVTTDLTIGAEPDVVLFRNIQHLSTRVSGRLRAGHDVLDLLERLHPTPAVCGRPRESALAVIAHHEPFDRGWYAGPIGWLDGEGGGEFAVSLRAALLRGPRALLFAGNGIMADSDAEAELDEVGLKLQPMIEALGGAVHDTAVAPVSP